MRVFSGFRMHYGKSVAFNVELKNALSHAAAAAAASGRVLLRVLLRSWDGVGSGGFK